MASYQSQHTGAQVDAAVGIASSLEGQVATLEDELSTLQNQVITLQNQLVLLNNRFPDSTTRNIYKITFPDMLNGWSTTDNPITVYKVGGLIMVQFPYIKRNAQIAAWNSSVVLTLPYNCRPYFTSKQAYLLDTGAAPGGWIDIHPGGNISVGVRGTALAANTAIRTGYFQYIARDIYAPNYDGMELVETTL